MDWADALLPVGATLREAVQCLEESHLQIILAIDADGRLVGTLTDGDIRRGLLDGTGLDSPIEGFVERKPLTVSADVDHGVVLQAMAHRRIHKVPVVDDDRRVVGLLTWSDLSRPVKRTNTLVVMAGGQGSRLRPLTEHTPKPMLPIAGRPILDHIIERANADGFRRFVLAVCYLGEVIEDYFGDGSSRGIEVTYLREEEAMGTAGGLSLLDPPEESVVVTNGDVLTAIRYGEMLDFHQEHGAAATMAVRQHEWRHPFGVVRTDGIDVVGLDEKPVERSQVNAGVYVLEPSTLELLGSGEPCDMPALFDRLRSQGRRTIAYPIHEPWLDVGHVDDYRLAQEGFRG
ncbi:MAG TPA: nucleotidyl transferase [Acidimicrobiaceae bacterium]|nr:nucleotidyl transferase [Acidimicrobiaceae bacterium]HAQ23583.1 nucleotidyl transferase [Acidimicrobiaceae bacterium]HCV33718.1 nucleotidyl transferase [Acidimicrobiaceae bacterium]